MTLHRSQLAQYIAHSPGLPVDKDRSEVRVYATIITGGVFGSFVMTALYLWAIEPSPLQMVANLNHRVGLYATAFVALAMCVMPHLFDLLFRPDKLRHKLPRKIAARSMFFAAVLWGMLATAARPLDLGLLPATYWATAVAYLLVGGAYGYSLNAQLASESINEKASAVG